MARRLNYKKKGKIDESTDDVIEEFLNYNGPSYFGDINKHLKKSGLEFKNSEKNRTGLAHSLKRLQKQQRIRKLPKDKDHMYPRYVSLNQSTFEASMDGYLLRDEITLMLQLDNTYNDFSKIQKRKKLNPDEEFILKNIYHLGFMALYMFISSYSRPIDPKDTLKQNKQKRQAWLNNALDFNSKRNSEANIFDHNLKSHFESDEKGNILDEGMFDKDFFESSDMREKINHMSKTMEKLFPESIGYIDEAKNIIESVKDKIKQNWLSIPQEKLPIREF